MKVTRILGFTEDEIQTLTAAGRILGEVAKVYHEETADTIVLNNEAEALVKALREVLYRLGRDDAAGE